MTTEHKIIPFSEVSRWVRGIQHGTRTVVVTNGCFDLLHAGHVSYLEAARAAGNFLLVGVNDDAAVRALKGPQRPLNRAIDRARVLAALHCVDAVCIFGGVTAAAFLAAARPNVWVKGGDYMRDSLNMEERAAVESAGGRILLLPFVPGHSTTALVQRL